MFITWRLLGVYVNNIMSRFIDVTIVSVTRKLTGCVVSQG